MPDAVGYSKMTIGRSTALAISAKCRSAISGLSCAPHMKSVGGNTRIPVAPPPRASRASATASCVPSA